jgi:hypothetical protein
MRAYEVSASVRVNGKERKLQKRRKRIEKEKLVGKTTKGRSAELIVAEQVLYIVREYNGETSLKKNRSGSPG